MRTIRYGADSVQKTYTGNVTFGDILGDENLQVVLGFGDNVMAKVNGVEMAEDSLVPDGALVVIETRSNCKAVN